MAKKAILKDQSGIEILPITRAELILDSEGKPAFRSAKLLATADQPGLMSPEDKRIIHTAAIIKKTENGISEIQNIEAAPIQPKAMARAVVMHVTTLEDYLENKLILDERPTKNSTNGVQSGGVYDELEEVVGAIYTNLKQV